MNIESKLQNNNMIAGAIKEEFLVVLSLMESDDDISIQTEMASLYGILVELNFPSDANDINKGDELLMEKYPTVLRLCNTVMKRLQIKGIIGEPDDKSELRGLLLVSKYLDSVLLDYIRGKAMSPSTKK